MGKIVSYTVDLANMPPLTAEEKARLEALAAKPDSEIDFSDIPRLTPDFFARAIRNPYFKPKKTSMTVRIDADVVAWLRSQGKGYQSRLNAILREHMLSSVSKQHAVAGKNP